MGEAGVERLIVPAFCTLWETVTVDSGTDTPYTYPAVARYLAAITLSDTRATRLSELRLGYEGASSVAISADYAYLLSNPSYGYYYGGGVAVSDGAAGGSAGAPRDTDETALAPRLKVVALADPEHLAIVESQRLGSGYSWWQIASVGEGKLVLSGGYGSGLAIFDLATPAAPLFRSYASTNGYAVSILRTTTDLYLSGGPYGIQKVSLE